MTDKSCNTCASRFNSPLGVTSCDMCHAMSNWLPEEERSPPTVDKPRLYAPLFLDAEAQLRLAIHDLKQQARYFNAVGMDGVVANLMRLHDSIKLAHNVMLEVFIKKCEGE